MSPQFALAVGVPWAAPDGTGLQLYGPFDTEDAALEAGMANFNGSVWSVVRLSPPTPPGIPQA